MAESKKGKSDTLPKRKIKTISVQGAEKRYKPTKHYVFIIQITYTDDTEYVIYRRYSDFFDFHTTLLDQFPIEAGEFKEPRTIPYLPGRKPFARNKRKVANERQGDLHEYCTELINMKDAISNCKLVREFFSAKQTDIEPSTSDKDKKKCKKLKEGGAEEDGNLDDISGPIDLENYTAIADYKAGDKTQISLVKNQIVDVLEKSENGWWLVQIDSRQGWAPATYLEPIDQGEEADDPGPIYGGEPFITIEAHMAEADDELSFEKGVIVDVLHKHLDGWWVASYNGNIGYLPANYVQRYNDRNLRPTESIIVRRKQNAKAKTTRKSVLNPHLPRKNLDIYKSVKRAVKDHTAEPELVYDDVIEEEEDPTVADLYVNDVQSSHKTGIMPNRSSFDEEDDEAHYSDVDIEDEDQNYENVSDINGIAPPIPPPKDYKPDLPPKAPNVPTIPRKQNQSVNAMSRPGNQTPEIPKKQKDHSTENGSANSSYSSNHTQAAPESGLQAELLKKLGEHRRKQNSPTQRRGRGNPTPAMTNVAPSTPPVPKRAGRDDNKPVLVPRTNRH